MSIVGRRRRLLDGLGGSLNPEVGWIRDQYITRTRSAMGDGRFAAISERGRHLSLDQVVGLIEAARTDTLVRASDGGAELPGSHGPRPFLPARFERRAKSTERCRFPAGSFVVPMRRQYGRLKQGGR